MNDFEFRLILCDLRGAGNVGSILRTGDAAGVELIYACGYTPYPALATDTRPPHVISSNARAIAKTALGAEHSVPVRYLPDAALAVDEAKRDGFEIIVIEQAEKSLNLFSFSPKARKLALVFGNEVTGVDPAIIRQAGCILEIPMAGKKESLNVAVAAAVALYQLRYGKTS
jgi:tRNA G18 (ribose-2'-O)-methylase SpoU